MSGEEEQETGFQGGKMGREGAGSSRSTGMEFMDERGPRRNGGSENRLICYKDTVKASLSVSLHCTTAG